MTAIQGNRMVEDVLHFIIDISTNKLKILTI